MDKVPRSGNSSKTTQDGRLRTTSFDNKLEERLRTSSFADQRNDQSQQSSSMRISRNKDGSRVTMVMATVGQPPDRQQEISYTIVKVIGSGSFGVVYQARLQEDNEMVAIKKVLQDRRFKNRELQIMRRLDHINIIQLKYFFFSSEEKFLYITGCGLSVEVHYQFLVKKTKHLALIIVVGCGLSNEVHCEFQAKKEELYLNLVLEFVPETVYRVARHYSKAKQMMPVLYIKLLMYQLFRSLAYIHANGVCHRDIKPQNLLLNPDTGVLKLCDFGSAKKLVKGEPNVSYICSRYYRAPELIFGATDYTVDIDVWSAGCVHAELLLGQPIFPGDSGVDQLVEIIKILGTPTREQIVEMNPNYTEFKFPQIRPHPWPRVFRPRTPPEAIDLVSRLLEYTPSNRITAIEACAHPFFDELRQPSTKMPNGRNLPLLFNFTSQELAIRPSLNSILVPSHSTTTLSTTTTSSTNNTSSNSEPSSSHQTK